MTERKQRLASLILGAIAGLMALAVGLTYARPDRARAPAVETSGRLSLREPAPLLDLNDATEDELRCLPGIGPALAEAITERREELGGFRGEEDVLSVPGVGGATLEKISPYITY